MGDDMEPTASGLDVSRITDYLYISAWPKGKYADELEALNIRLILSMHLRRPSKAVHQLPLRVLWLPTFDNRFMPMPIGTLRRGVEAALPVIKAGNTVLTHCKAGMHRSVAMASCVLIGMGYSADDAMRLIKEQREVADPYIGHIQSRIRKFERDWQRRHDHADN